MKTILGILAAALISTSCVKQEAAPVKQNEKYYCICETSVSFVDHCGNDSFKDTTSVSADGFINATDQCLSHNLNTADEYSVTVRTCALR